jgi:hypothetical protein
MMKKLEFIPAGFGALQKIEGSDNICLNELTGVFYGAVNV